MMSLNPVKLADDDLCEEKVQTEDSGPLFEGADKSEEDRKELKVYKSVLKTKLDDLIGKEEEVGAAQKPFSARLGVLRNDIQVEWNKEVDGRWHRARPREDSGDGEREESCLQRTEQPWKITEEDRRREGRDQGRIAFH